MPYSARRPVILSHRHSLTDLIVRDFHAQMKHQNVDATIAQIRTRFWVTKMRRVLKEVISSCNECKLQRTRPMPPIMGPLPEDRLEAGGWPFKYTGLDYFGPLLVTVSRHREKRWVALFTCLTTRAIHLELAHDLSTDSCIIAMRNFVCRRGPVHRLRSDNGKNFVGADREAKRFGDVFETERIQSELSSRSIECDFNCPSNPSEGGVWERMVQCVKRVLRHTLKEVAPRDHVLESFLIEAENVVNSRQLTHLPVDADQEAPLTPNDLLKGAATCRIRLDWMRSCPRRVLRESSGGLFACCEIVSGGGGSWSTCLRLCAARSGAGERSPSARAIWSSSAILPCPDESGARESWRRSTAELMESSDALLCA
nr:uncharacterized protein LOC118879735 [Drosophila suzukii]